MTESSVRGARVAAGLDRTSDATRLTVRFEDADAPTLTGDLRGTVPPSTVRAEGGELVFGLRPFPGTALSGHGELELEVRIAPDPTDAAATLTVDGPHRYPFEELVVPGGFRLSGRPSDDWHFVLPLGEGLSLPAGADASVERMGDLPRRVDLFGDWITLPLVALTRGRHARGGGLLVTSPQSHDHTVGLLPETQNVGPGFELVQRASLGRFGYRRVWRLRWVREPGLVALADAIRTELRAAGVPLEPLPAKLAARGTPNRLIESVGGTHLWWHVDPVPSWLPGQLRRDGLRSVVLMGALDDRRSGAAKDAGMIAGSYFMSSDIYPPGEVELREWRNLFPPEGFTDGWPDQLARTREGWLLPNWAHTPAPEPQDLWESEEFLDEHGEAAWRPRAAVRFHPTQGYYRCPHFHVETVQGSGLPVLDREGASAVFFDVATAAGSIECHSLDHPCDRRTDIARRRQALELLGSGGRVVSSECGKWWALDVVDAFEGILKFGGHLNNRVLGDYPFRPEWWETQFNLELRVPLFGLVARHSIVRTMWWGQGHDRHPETWDAKDALCALFGANPIFVSDPAHPLSPDTPKWDRFLRTASAFDLLRQRTFGQGIRSYEVLHRHLGVTEFEDGTAVRANVGPVDVEGVAAGSFEVRDGAGRLLWPQPA